MTHEDAWNLLNEYNKEPFHLYNAQVMEGMMRPSKSVRDMEVKSIKKKFKQPSFAADCSRDVIQREADMLDWTLNELFAETLGAMKNIDIVQ